MQKTHVFSKYTKIFLFLILFLAITSSNNFLSAQEISLGEKLSGKILLQTESRGEAWYVSTSNHKRYYLGRPTDAFYIMRHLGDGITNENLEKIPIGLNNTDNKDSDHDGLEDKLEIAIGTDPQNKDTDGDGYNDYLEIINNFNPKGIGLLNIDKNFSAKVSGRIFIQTEKNGEAWYINPSNQKRYYLGKPTDAFQIMQELSIGITNDNLALIPISSSTEQKNAIDTNNSINAYTNKNNNSQNVINLAASAIRAKNKVLAASYFIPEMKNAIYYNLENMSDESILALSNILSDATLTKSNSTEIVYTDNVYFSLGDQTVPLKFIIKKQTNGDWLLTNL